MTKFDIKKERNRKRKGWRWAPKSFRGANKKRTQVWMKTYLCWRKTELKQSYIPII